MHFHDEAEHDRVPFRFERASGEEKLDGVSTATTFWCFLWIMWFFLLFKVIDDIIRSNDLSVRRHRVQTTQRPRNGNAHRPMPSDTTLAVFRSAE